MSQLEKVAVSKSKKAVWKTEELSRKKGNVSVASRSKWYDGTYLTTEADADATFRTMHEALCDIDSLILMYGNIYQDGRTTTLGVFTINVSIDVGSDTYPLFFNNGEPTKKMNLGARVVTDELRVSIKKGTRFFVRTHVVSVVGERRPKGLTIFGGQNSGEGIMSGDATTGTFTTTNVNPYFAYSPLVVLGEPSRVKDFKTVGICGDSISAGAGHANVSVDGKPVGEVGYMQIGAMRADWGYVSAGMNGQKAQDFASPTKRTTQLQMLKNCDLVIVEYGTNDLADATRTFENIRDYLLSIHQAFWSMGIPTAQTTISPQTTSTDSWATLENQTVKNANFAPGPDSARGKLNRWIMNNTDGINGIDVNPAWESSPESGLWGVSPKTTTDGVHPNSFGHDNHAANAVRDYLLNFKG